MSDQTTSGATAAGSTSADAIAGPKPIDISVEKFREYVFGDGSVLRIDKPVSLYIVRGSHRVVDDCGITHRPERGYLGIRWMQNDGLPFTF